MAHQSAAGSRDFRNVAIDDKALAIGVINDRGEIVRANDPWQEFAEGLHSGGNTYSIEEYIQRVCEAVAKDSEDGVTLISQGIRSVLKGEREFFQFKYSRHTGAGERWIDGVARWEEYGGVPAVQVSHCKVTSGPGKPG